ncbi:MAG: M15 family metallopeptidase [Rhodobacteraceae bacterium]|nr:M15 family metallopeptidase [Paracoccaceae bacterium]
MSEININSILTDDSISDEVKVALIPEVLKTRISSTDRQNSKMKWLFSAPVAAALASIVTVTITESTDFFGQRGEQDHEVALESLKFQHSLIRTALSDDVEMEKRAEALLFFSQSKLVNGLDEAKLEEWKKDETKFVPAIPMVSTQSAELPELETPTLTVSQQKELHGDDIYGPDTANLIPTNEQIAEVLGSPSCKGNLTTIQLPYRMRIDWNLRQSTNRLAVHEAAADYFRQAFQNIAENGVVSYLRYSGAYIHRKRRGGQAWSRHAWGIEIDFDAAHNSLRMTQDQATMHPGIVRAFKDAGFAWVGDTNRDAMSFVLSSVSLAEIKASGYNKLCAPK